MKMTYRKNEDIYDYIKKCDGIKVVYGVTFGESLIEEEIFKIDYFCDRREQGNYIKDIPIISASELGKLVEESKKRALVLICVGANKPAVQSIYRDLCMLDINADIFDYFDCTYFFTDKTFLYREKEIELYENIYNCGYTNMRMTERSVELALAQNYLGQCKENVIEIGG